MSDRLSHPDTAGLLAFLDGELPPITAWRTRRHIARCWTCRGRLVELQNTIADVSRTWAAPPPEVDRTDIARARWNFRRAASQFESTNPGRTSPPPRRLALALTFAVAILVVAAVVFTPRSVPRLVPVASGKPPAAAELLAAVEAQELAPIRAVREDRFAVQLATGRTSRPVARELRVLTAPSAGLHSARWLDGDGVVQNAVFAADSDQDALYSRREGLRPATLRRASRYTSLYRAASASRNADSLEAAVLDWLRTQIWEPVSLAREAADFCTQSGARLSIRRESGEWVWTAEAPVGKATVHLTLRGAERQPASLMEISWQSSGGIGFVRFHREGRYEYPTVAAAPVWLRAASLRRPPPEPVPVTPEPARTPRPDLLDAEVEAVAALHRAGYCSPDIVRVSAGLRSVRITGSLTGEAERERIETILRTIPHAAALTFELQLIDLDSLNPLPVAAPTQRTGQRSHAAPAEAWLRTRMGVGTRASERDMFSRMSSLVGSAEDVLSDAWVLEHLAAQFPPDRQALLSPDARDMLLAIMAEHARSAASRLARIDTLLGFVSPTTPAASLSPAAWQQQAPEFRRAAQRFSDTMLRLFAGVESASAISENPEQSGLPELLRQLQSRATEIASR